MEKPENVLWKIGRKLRSKSVVAMFLAACLLVEAIPSTAFATGDEASVTESAEDISVVEDVHTEADTGGGETAGIASTMEQETVPEPEVIPAESTEISGDVVDLPEETIGIAVEDEQIEEGIVADASNKEIKEGSEADAANKEIKEGNEADASNKEIKEDSEADTSNTETKESNEADASNEKRKEHSEADSVTSQEDSIGIGADHKETEASAESIDSSPEKGIVPGSDLQVNAEGTGDTENTDGSTEASEAVSLSLVFDTTSGGTGKAVITYTDPAGQVVTDQEVSADTDGIQVQKDTEVAIRFTAGDGSFIQAITTTAGGVTETVGDASGEVALVLSQDTEVAVTFGVTTASAYQLSLSADSASGVSVTYYYDGGTDSSLDQNAVDIGAGTEVFITASLPGDNQTAVPRAFIKQILLINTDDQTEQALMLQDGSGLFAGTTFSFRLSGNTEVKIVQGQAYQVELKDSLSAERITPATSILPVESRGDGTTVVWAESGDILQITAQKYDPQGERYKVNAIKETISGQTANLSGFAYDEAVHSGSTAYTVSNHSAVLEAEFVRLYTVSAVFSEGEVTYRKDSNTSQEVALVSGEVVEFEAGTEIFVNASLPDEADRRSRSYSSILVNGQEELEDSDVLQHLTGWSSGMITMDRDFQWKFTVSENQYQLTTDEKGNGQGSVSIVNDDPVHGDKVEIIVTPDENSTVAGISIQKTDINGNLDASATEEIVTDDSSIYDYQLSYGVDGSIRFVTREVTEHQRVTVDFAAIDSADRKVTASQAGFTFTNALRTESGLHVYRPGTEIEFVMGNQTALQIREMKILPVGGVWKTGTMSVSYAEEMAVEKIRVFAKASGESLYSLREMELPEEGIEIAYDTDRPVVNEIILPELPEGQTVYGDSIPVTVRISDRKEDVSDYSGISKVIWEIYRNEEDTAPVQEGEILLNGGAEVTVGEDTVDQEGNPCQIVIDKDLVGASSTAKIVVRAVDQAENESEATELSEYSFKINPNEPQVEISIDGERHPESSEGYYNTVRTLTIKVTEPAVFFEEDAEVFADGIEISATDASGNAVAFDWKEKLKWEYSDTGVQTAKIEFDQDANYLWEMAEYTNQAGKTAGITANGDSVYAFTVDREGPQGKIKSTEPNQDLTAQGALAKIKNLMLILKRQVEVKAEELVDVTSGTDGMKILYYKQNDTDGIEDSLTQGELEALYQSQPGLFTEGSVEVGENEHAAVYARLTDKAGNTAYIGSNGVLVDMLPGVITVQVPPANEHGFYNSDVILQADIREGVADNGVYSGIRKIYYTVQSDGVYTQADDMAHPEKGVLLYEFRPAEKHPQKDELVEQIQSESLQYPIRIEGSKNNSNHVAVKIWAEDNAGNEFQMKKDGNVIQQIEMSINTRHAEVSVVLDDQNLNRIEKEIGYYRKTDSDKDKNTPTRTATVTITDRGTTFDAAAATEAVRGVLRAVNAENVGVSVNKDQMITVGSWKKTDKEPDTDENIDTFEAVVSFYEDAVYHCDWEKLSFKNLAGMVNVKAKVEGTTVKHFAVDNTAPMGTLKVERTLGGTWTGNHSYEVTGKTQWSDYLRNLVFYLTNQSPLTVSVEAKDATSPVELAYHKTDRTTVLTKEELDQITFERYTGAFPIAEEERSQIYAKVTDYAGNYIYIRSDGFIVETSASEIALNPSEPDVKHEPKEVEKGILKHGYYNGNSEITVDIVVREDVTKPYSGIRKVSWEVISNNQVTQSGDSEKNGILGLLDQPAAYDKLPTEFHHTLMIKDTDGANNTSDVTVKVTAEDNAGNITAKSIVLDIDTSAPLIEISYDDNNDNTFYKKNRKATIVITERGDHFDPVSATEGISLRAQDAQGRELALDRAAMISEWRTEVLPGDTGSSDQTRHVATIDYTMDARYTFSIQYTDKSGKVNRPVAWADGHVRNGDVDIFTIDKKAPTATLTSDPEEHEETKWTELVTERRFGIWSNRGIMTTAVYEDPTSPVVKAAWYKSSDTVAITEAELSRMPEQQWMPYDTNKDIYVGPNETFTLYLRLEDAAGNVGFYSTDGLIVDNVPPVIGDLIAEGDAHGSGEDTIYSDSVSVPVSVEDPVAGNSYSGIKEITYTVYSLGNETDSQTVEVLKQTVPLYGDLSQSYEDLTIQVDSETNNSNEILVEVRAVDNAGNETTQELELQIDTTPPEILITYDNNTPDSEHYYKEARVATIAVSERNFDPELVTLTITNTDGPTPEISSWSESGGGGNGDDTVNSATITYDADGDYTFEIECEDMAANQAEEIAFAAGTANEKEFTIDLTVPVIEVSYDNNEVYNERYFQAPRTATVRIEEHNFDTERVEFTQTASIGGGGASIPGVSWSSSGDVHTATIPYTSDGDYTFEVTMQDLAGNESEEATYGGEAAKEFTVDTEFSELEITGVENGKAYKAEVKPGVRFSDINFHDHEIRLTRTRRGQINVDVTEQFIKGLSTGPNGGSGTFDTFAKIPENDGIYTLYAKMTDKAGNEKEEEVKFTVNRFGSVYVYGDYLVSLIQDGGTYVQDVTEDLIITEYNADKLVQGSLKVEITHDGKPLEQVEYDMTPEVNQEVAPGKSGWHEYVYTIAKENFEKDGVYKIAISSRDQTGNTPENTEAENTQDEIRFWVDATAPELNSITGLEEPVIDATSVDVGYTVYDTIGLNSIKVYVDGTQLGEAIDVFEDPNNYNGSFQLKESGSTQTVRIVVEDLAGNVTDTGAPDFTSAYVFHDSVIVSTNVWVRLLANPMFKWVLIAAAVAAAAVFFLMLIWKKRKLQKEEEK